MKRYKHHPSCHQILNNVVQVHIKCFAHQTGCERNLLKKRNLSQLLNYFELWWFQREWKLINSRNMRSKIWRWTPNNYPVNIYLFKVNNINSRKGCEVCSKLAIKTPERRQWRRSGIFIFEQISHLLLFLLLTLSR